MSCLWLRLTALVNRHTQRSCQPARIGCVALTNIFKQKKKMGEVKSVKMDTWTATESPNTLFADGKFEATNYSYIIMYTLFRRGASTLFSRSSHLWGKSAQNKARSNAGRILHTLCWLEQKVMKCLWNRSNSALIIYFHFPHLVGMSGCQSCEC